MSSAARYLDAAILLPVAPVTLQKSAAITITEQPEFLVADS